MIKEEEEEEKNVIKKKQCSYLYNNYLVIRIYLDKNLIYAEAPAARSCSYKNYLHKFQVYWICPPPSNTSNMTANIQTLFLNEIHSMQGWTTTTRHSVTRNRKNKKIKTYGKSV